MGNSKIKRKVKILAICAVSISLVFTGFIVGNVTELMESEAGTGQLSAQGDSWQTDNSETVICQRDGRYKIDVVGGGYAAGDYYDNLASVKGKILGFNNLTGLKMCTLDKPVHGGHLIGEINLKKGDAVQIIRYLAAVPRKSGGSSELLWQPIARGGDAMAVLINGTPVIGAGGCSGSVIHFRYEWDSNVYNSKPVRDALIPVIGIDNSKFSPGSSGYVEADYRIDRDHWGNDCWGAGTRNGYSYYFGDSYFQLYGTLPGSKATTNGTIYEFSAGTNYLNPDLVTLKSQTNDGIYPNCKITCIQANVVAEDMYSANVRIASAMEQLVDKFVNGIKVDIAVDNRGVESELAQINSTLKNNSNTKESGNISDPITVVAGKAFNVWIRGESKGGTQDGVTIIDNDTSDGYVQVKGTIKNEGLFEVVIAGSKYVFNVVSEPNSSNVKAILN